jgi:hypothetical protein
MVDRQKTLVEFVTAWAEYQMRMTGVGSAAKQHAANDPALQQMIGRITDDLASSPQDQRLLAMQLAFAEFAKSA